MKFKIGFSAEEKKENPAREVRKDSKAEVKPKPSLVDIRFPDIYKSYTYYNDSFEQVFPTKAAEGTVLSLMLDDSAEPEPGNYFTGDFKIKLSDYKRVISVADTDVKGQLYFHKTKVVSFDPTTIPFGKIASWYFPPTDPEDIVSGEDDSTILLDKPETWKADIDPSEYVDIDDFFGVVYLSLDNGVGRAIVKGRSHHAVEFFYENGEISKLTCDCYSAGMCEHEIAALFELRHKLKWIDGNCADEIQKTSYFAELDKAVFCKMVLMSRQNGSFQIG